MHNWHPSVSIVHFQDTPELMQCTCGCRESKPIHITLEVMVNRVWGGPDQSRKSEVFVLSCNTNANLALIGET